MTEKYKLSPSEYYDYNRGIFRDFGSDTEIDLRCCPYYQSFQMILMPRQIPYKERDLALFIVKIPTVRRMKFSWELYKKLMRERVEFMICKWIGKSGEDKSQTYQRLKETLYRLNPNATPPSLTSYPGWEWAEFWGYHFLEQDQTWTALFQQNVGGLDFPIDIPQENSSSQELREIHDNIHLEQFLSELACGL